MKKNKIWRNRKFDSTIQNRLVGGTVFEAIEQTEDRKHTVSSAISFHPNIATLISERKMPCQKFIWKYSIFEIPTCFYFIHAIFSEKIASRGIDTLDEVTWSLRVSFHGLEVTGGVSVLKLNFFLLVVL